MANKMKMHKRYIGPPDVIYVSLEHNSFCGRVMKSDILTSNDSEVTCLLCIANIFRYPALLERKKKRDKDKELMVA